MGHPERLPLDRLQELSIAELREEWARCHGAPAPKLSAELLRSGIAYRLQEKRYSGISRETKRILLQTSQAAACAPGTSLAKPPPRKLTPGTRLVRDWYGTGHTVRVLEEGFEYDSLSWRSLTAIAKSITGTHRNGPRFFGLTQ